MRSECPSVARLVSVTAALPAGAKVRKTNLLVVALGGESDTRQQVPAVPRAAVGATAAFLPEPLTETTARTHRDLCFWSCQLLPPMPQAVRDPLDPQRPGLQSRKNPLRPHSHRLKQQSVLSGVKEPRALYCVSGPSGSPSLFVQLSPVSSGGGGVFPPMLCLPPPRRVRSRVCAVISIPWRTADKTYSTKFNLTIRMR